MAKILLLRYFKEAHGYKTSEKNLFRTKILPYFSKIMASYKDPNGLITSRLVIYL